MLFYKKVGFMQKKKVAIVGAGLSGLNCARLLEKKFDVTIFEKNSKIGGRVMTTHEDGYIFDHGFQVFLKDYPEASDAFDFSKLNLKEFTPGAMIRLGHSFYKTSDPIRVPQDTLATLMAPIGNLKDKILILKLKIAVKKIDPKLKNISTYQYLKEFGFSEKIISNFFVPFFSGIFLEKELKTSAYFFSFLFSIFSKCNASIPVGGMEELPQNIFNQLKETTIHLNSEVTEISKESVTMNGEMHSFDYVISAFDQPSSKYNSVTTDYFETSISTPKKPTLYLNGNPQGVINHIAPMSLVNPRYGQKEKYLWSVNLLSPNHDTAPEVVKTELEEWFNGTKFNHLKRYTIKKALPSHPNYGNEDLKRKGIYYCGDHMQDPSINGALRSARLVAEDILADNS